MISAGPPAISRTCATWDGTDPARILTRDGLVLAAPPDCTWAVPRSTRVYTGDAEELEVRDAARVKGMLLAPMADRHVELLSAPLPPSTTDGA